MVEAAALAQTSRDELMGRMAPVFTRREPRLQAGKYVAGLMGDLPGKNGWTLAEAAGDATPESYLHEPERNQRTVVPSPSASGCRWESAAGYPRGRSLGGLLEHSGDSRRCLHAS